MKITLIVFLLFQSILHAKTKINGIAAIVAGNIISINDVREAMGAHAALIYRDKSLSNQEKAKMLENAKEDVLDTLINREVMLSEFKRLGASLKPQVVDKDIEDFVKKQFKGDYNKFVEELKKGGFTIKKFKEMRKKLIIVEAMRSRVVSDVGEPSDKEVKDAYKVIKERTRGESSINLHTITVPKVVSSSIITSEDQRKLANEIRQKAIQGGDFSVLARTYSNDSYREHGGDRGMIKESELSGQLKEIALSLNVGEISKVIDLQSRFVIIYISKKILGKTKPYKELKDLARKYALKEKREAKYKKWLVRTKKKLSIVRNEI